MKRNRYILFLLFASLFWGCGSSTEPGLEISCNGASPYFFFIGDGWLGAGQNLFNISDPSNPLSYATGGYGYFSDTAFIAGEMQYSINGSEVFIDTIGSRNYPQQEALTAYSRHLAYSPGYIYFLRHQTYSGGSNFCSQAIDSVNELDVDEFTDTSYSATLLSQTPLTDPTDIAITGTTLFVLDGASGLKIFSLSDPAHPSLISTMANAQGDHIQLTGQSTLLVTMNSSIVQYDVSNPANPQLLGTIQ